MPDYLLPRSSSDHLNLVLVVFFIEIAKYLIETSVKSFIFVSLLHEFQFISLWEAMQCSQEDYVIVDQAAEEVRPNPEADAASKIPPLVPNFHQKSPTS